jgi:hypothetical protein
MFFTNWNNRTSIRYIPRGHKKTKIIPGDKRYCPVIGSCFPYLPAEGLPRLVNCRVADEHDPSWGSWHSELRSDGGRGFTTMADAGSRRSELWGDGVLEVALAGRHEASGFRLLFSVGPGLPKEKFLASCSRFVFLPFFHPHLCQFSRFPAFSWRTVIFPFSGDFILSLQ